MEFCKETKFKESEVGRIPEGWKLTTLTQVLELIRNGLTKKQNTQRRGYAITRIETISRERIDEGKIGYVENITHKEIKDYRLSGGDILFSHINSLEHIGKTAIYEGNPPLVLHGMNLLLLRPRKSKISPRFLLYLLKLLRLRLFFSNIAKKAVNQASINQTELRRIKIPLPPLQEQQRITSILSAVDEAIQKTDEIIQKTQELKKGLMQELLSRGIGHKDFKDTEIGRIPKEWDVMKVKCLGKVITGTTPRTKIKDYWDGTIPFVTPTDISESKYVYQTERKVTQRGAQKGRLIPKDSVLVTCIASIGKVALAYEECITNQQINAIVCQEGVDPDYVYYIITFRERALQNQAGATTNAIVKKSLFEKFLIPIPRNHNEQQKIASILSSVDEKIEKERQTKEQLERLKRGLMQILLTGKVRVKLD